MRDQKIGEDEKDLKKCLLFLIKLVMKFYSFTYNYRVFKNKDGREREYIKGIRVG